MHTQKVPFVEIPEFFPQQIFFVCVVMVISEETDLEDFTTMGVLHNAIY